MKKIKKKLSKKKVSQTQELLNQAITLQNKGEYLASESLLQQILVVDPGHASAYHHLGLIAQSFNNLDAAVLLVEKSIRLGSKSAETFVNYGSLLKQTGKLKQAEEAYKHAIKLNKNLYQAWFNLAHLRFSQKEYTLAESALLELVKQSPAYPEAWLTLGYIYADLNDIDKASAAFENELANYPKQANALCGLANIHYKKHNPDEGLNLLNQATKEGVIRADLLQPIAQLYYNFGEFEQASTFCEKALQNKVDINEVLWLQIQIEQSSHNPHGYLNLINKSLAKNDSNNEVAVRLCAFKLIAEWQLGLTDACHQTIREIQQLSDTLENNPVNNAVIAYYIFLGALLNELKEQSGKIYTEKRIYTIGDSHTLTNLNRTLHLGDLDYQIESKLILGCKAWHLAQKGANQYKSSFKQAIDSIPKGSTVILMLGEIDCRIDEGIINTTHKSTVHQVVKTTVSNYVSYVLKQTHGKDINLCFYGIPAPYLSTDHNKKDAKLLIDIIRSFNLQLKKETLDANCDFIDIYTATTNKDGIADGSQHIDEFHLLPQAIEQAILLSLSSG